MTVTRTYISQRRYYKNNKKTLQINNKIREIIYSLINQDLPKSYIILPQTKNSFISTPIRFQSWLMGREHKNAL